MNVLHICVLKNKYAEVLLVPIIIIHPLNNF